MQKVEWRLVENFVEAELFQQAYDLVENEQNPSYELKEGEAGIYYLKPLHQESDFSTEIEFNRKFIKRYLCTCGEAGKKLCRHLVASVILYRRIKNAEEEKALDANSLSNLPSRISLPAILSQIPREDLNRFLQRYARINKHFGQAIKLHFASKVQVASPEQKYHDLIRSMTRLIPLANGKLSKQSVQSLFWVSEELLLQADDLIAMETPIEAFAICMELLQSFQSIYRKLEMYIGEYEKYFITIHQKIKTILDFELAPELRLEFTQKLVTAFADPSYPFINSPNNLFEILYPFPDQEIRNQLKEITLKKIGRREMNSTPLIAWIKNAIKFKDENLLQQALDTNGDIAKWISAIDSISINNREYAKQVARWVMLKTKEEFWKFKLMEKIWSLFPDDSDSIVYALGLLTYTPEEKFVQYLVGKHVSHDMIEHALLDSKHSKTIHLLINFYFETDQVPKAKSLIEQNLSIDLIKSITPKFYPIEDAWVLSIYKTTLTKYLDTYVGPVPANKIQSLLGFLQLIKAKGLAEHLHKWLKKEFSDHPTLIEIL